MSLWSKEGISTWFQQNLIWKATLRTRKKERKDAKVCNWVLLKATLWRNLNISPHLSVPSRPLWGPEGSLNTRPACHRPRSQRASCFLLCLCWDFDLISSAYPKPSPCCLNSWSSLGAQGSDSPLGTREPTTRGRAWEPGRREGWRSSARGGETTDILSPSASGRPHGIRGPWETVFIGPLLLHSEAKIKPS